jgi:ABC-type multidrug transport system fused ATPase/permease subunit
VLDEPEAVPVRSSSRIRRLRGPLKYRDVSSYPPGGRRVLDGIDQEIEPGMTLGLLGACGSGKSTLLALAPRIYDLEENRGAILLDGRDGRPPPRRGPRSPVGDDLPGDDPLEPDLRPA